MAVAVLCRRRNRKKWLPPRIRFAQSGPTESGPWTPGVGCTRLAPRR